MFELQKTDVFEFKSMFSLHDQQGRGPEANVQMSLAANDKATRETLDRKIRAIASRKPVFVFSENDEDQYDD